MSEWSICLVSSLGLCVSLTRRANLPSPPLSSLLFFLSVSFMTEKTVWFNFLRKLRLHSAYTLRTYFTYAVFAFKFLAISRYTTQNCVHWLRSFHCRSFPIPSWQRNQSLRLFHRWWISWLRDDHSHSTSSLGLSFSIKAIPISQLLFSSWLNVIFTRLLLLFLCYFPFFL